jgi:Integrase zinc binding domain
MALLVAPTSSQKRGMMFFWVNIGLFLPLHIHNSFFPLQNFYLLTFPPLFISVQSLHSPLTAQFFSNVSRHVMKILSGKSLLFISKPLHTDILFSCHDSCLGGHPRQIQTLVFVSCNYLWPGMQTFVQHYIKACDTCPCIKSPCHKPYGLLKPLDIPEHPWKSISMDFIIKLPLSHGYNSIWVICDCLMCYTHLIPCNETIDVPGLAWPFLDHIFHYHGLPDSIPTRPSRPAYMHIVLINRTIG